MTTGLNDCWHYIGGDLSSSGTGDVQMTAGTTRGQQRILRRLLTNPGDYLFAPDYGAGLPAHIGRVADIAKITALVRGQILLEDAVARTPAPDIAVVSIQGGVAIAIKYHDAATGQPVALKFDVKK